MIERLFLYRVDAKTAGSAVGGQDDFVIRTGADETKPMLAFPEPAEARAKVTLQATVIDPVPVSSGYGANVGCFRRSCHFLNHQNDIGVCRGLKQPLARIFMHMHRRASGLN